MSRSVRITTRAFEDLQQTVEWWSDNRSTDQALRWYDGIMVKMQTLPVMPESHPLARENRRVPFELREMHFGLSGITHRILFRIQPDTIEVLTIRSTAQAELSAADLIQ